MAVKNINLGSGAVLHIDPRDIPLPCALRKEVWNWAQQQGIDLEGQMYGVKGLDVWRIRDEQQRLWFSMRWS